MHWETREIERFSAHSQKEIITQTTYLVFGSRGRASRGGFVGDWRISRPVSSRFDHALKMVSVEEAPNRISPRIHYVHTVGTVGPLAALGPLGAFAGGVDLACALVGLAGFADSRRGRDDLDASNCKSVRLRLSPAFPSALMGV